MATRTPIETLRLIAEAGRRSIATFESRVRDRKDRLTWWAVNELQDCLAAAAGEAERTLEAHGEEATAPELTPIDKVPHYAVIIRAIHERGRDQRQALDELDRRGLWLTDAQKEQAGLEVPKAPSVTQAELYQLLMAAHGFITQYSVLRNNDVSTANARTELLQRLQAAWEALPPA
jgi:hypothetical protein